MQHWDIDEFVAAANHLARTSEFMPKPADFEGLRRHSVMPATEAWGKVLSVLPGHYRYAGIDECTDRAVATLGGYRALAMCPTASLDFKRRGFIEAYEDVVDGQSRAGLLPLNIDALAIAGAVPTTRRVIAAKERDK